MQGFKVLALSAVAGLCLTVAIPRSQAQVDVSVGVAPECPYGYYDYAPYTCAPYGYYGSEWFSGGLFIGAGPWFHGPANFNGHVNNRFDPQHGYHGATPNRGEKPMATRGVAPSHFKGNETRDGRGHVTKGKR
jgi:hypothetical protein